MRVAILGAGGMGNVHAAQYAKMPEVEVGFAEGNETRAARFAERHGALHRDTPEALLEWADVIDICLPSDLHAEWAHRAIARRKPVFVEKPLARTWDEAEGVVRAAEAANVPLMPGQVVRFFPEYALAHRMVKDGRVGRPAAARLRRGGAAPTGSQGWFMNHERSGGVLVDLAIHDFDWLRWTLGEVERVTARTVGFATGRNEGPDYGLTTLKFKSGAVAHVESTWMDPSGFRTHFEVAGSDGLIQWDSRENRALRRIGPSGDEAFEDPRAPLDDPYYKELRGFLTAVETGTPPPVTGRDGLAALAIALAAEESARQEGLPVPVPVIYCGP